MKISKYVDFEPGFNYKEYHCENDGSKEYQNRVFCLDVKPKRY